MTKEYLIAQFAFRHITDYKEIFNNLFIENWTKHTNHYLDYLSGGQFQLFLSSIKYIKTEYWNGRTEEIPDGDRTKFIMVVHPTAYPGGYYNGNGLFYVNPFHIQLDEGDEEHFDPLSLHEIFHGFFGGDHSTSEKSTMSYAAVIGLTAQETKFLGWPVMEPLDVHPMRFYLDYFSEKVVGGLFRD